MFPKLMTIAVVGRSVEKCINDTFCYELIYPSYWHVKHLKFLASALGFSYELIAADGNTFGRLLPNGSWTGASGMIQRREADMILGNMILNPLTQETLLLSFPKDIGELTFITRKHQYVPNAAIFLHPFSVPVWISIIACITIMPLIFRCLMRKKYSVPAFFTSILSSLIGQGMPLKPQNTREYILLAFWILSAALLSYFYSAVLLSFVTFPSLYGIRNTDELANAIKDGEYWCATYPHSTIIFSKSPDPNFKIISGSLLENNGFGDFIEVLELTAAGKKKPCFIGQRHEFLPYKEMYFIAEETLSQVSMVYGMHKEFCCKEELDYAIHRVRESGIYDKILRHKVFKMFLYDYEEFGKSWEESPSASKLTMTMLKGPFLFLIASLSLAFLVFLAEVCCGRRNRIKPVSRK